MAKDINEKKSGFKPGVYAGVAIVVVAVVLVVLTVFSVKTKYTGFSDEKTAQFYVDTIVQNADGYNAYKQTLVSKNQKYGTFITNAYMAPYINDGEDVKQREFASTDEEAEIKNPLYDEMYRYYVELITTYGWDDYDSIFSNYFEKLSQERKARYGDEYMDTEFMFGVFESNVSRYGMEVAGAEEELGQDNKTVVQQAITGKYQEMYGMDYTFTTAVTDIKAVDDVETYKSALKERITPLATSGEAKAAAFNLDGEKKEAMVSAFEKLDSTDAITAVSECNIQVTLADGTVVAELPVYVVKIGSSWYVDNTNVDTSSLYLAINK
ncbi:MAG: hypothetical protein J5964_06720 [Eubacterium sp.]|nr:hypothetical protein [Eubacterium sp.]